MPFAALLLAALPQADGVTTVPAYVLAGQSNMEGYGAAAALPAIDQLPDPNVRIWNWCDAVQAWEDLTPGVNTNLVQGSDCFASGVFGPEVALGKALAAHDGEPVHLIKFAWGNTWLAKPATTDPCDAPCLDIPAPLTWDPANGALYARLVAEIQNANAALAPDAVLEVRGIFFAQGVNDAYCACHADAYAAQLAAFRDTLRADLAALGVAPDPHTPLVLSWVPDRLAHVLGVLLPTGDTIRAAQVAVARGDVHTGLVETSDYTLIADGVHFDAGGQLQHGADLFDAFTQSPLPDPTLTAQAGWVTASTGGVQDLQLLDPAAAGAQFLVLSSLSGTSGFDHFGVTVPLAPDPFFLLTVFVGLGGVVDGAGVASAQVAVPALPSLAGLRAHHALVSFVSTANLTSIQGSSNAIGMTLIADLPVVPL